jgi:hypothetical protein
MKKAAKNMERGYVTGKIAFKKEGKIPGNLEMASGNTGKAFVKPGIWFEIPGITYKKPEMEEKYLNDVPKFGNEQRKSRN